MIRGAAAAVWLALGAQALAAEDIQFDPAPVLGCLNEGAQHVCIGTGKDPCARATGASTVVIERCLKAEYQFWEALVMRAHARLEAEGHRIDAQTEFADPQPPRRVAALEHAHQAWLDYRAAHCAYQLVRWHGGSGAGGAYYRCMMELTGAYALQLQPDVWMHEDEQDRGVTR